MKEDYKIAGPTKKLEVEVEEKIVSTLQKMQEFTKIPASELANTALKRFISQHKDFLPPVRH